MPKRALEEEVPEAGAEPAEPPQAVEGKAEEVEANEKEKKETVKADVEPAKHGVEIKYEIKEVPGKGRGIFVAEDIPKGTVWYNYDKAVASGSSIIRNKKEFCELVSSLSREEITVMLQLVYCIDEDHVNDIRGDPARFTNHSREPNSSLLPNNSSVFSRDMKAGEEILEDYRLYADPSWYSELLEKYEIPVDYL